MAATPVNAGTRIDSLPPPPVPSLSAMAAQAVGAGARQAPYATLSVEQQLMERRMAERERLGPTLWRPATAAGAADAPAAGLVREVGEADGPIARDMSWANAGGMRPTSRRGAGSARPKTSSQFTFGWG